MASSILSDNGVSSGSAGLKTSADSTGVLALQTTTAGGTATTAVTIDTSQNVGIGTASPAQKLDVAGTLAVRNASTSYINTYCSGGGNRDYQLGVNGSAFVFNDITSGTTERMRIDSSGNVGIGTTSPTSIAGYTSLAINNATNGGLIDLKAGGTLYSRWVATSSQANLSTEAAIPFVFQTNSTERMRINALGQIGVGMNPNGYAQFQVLFDATTTANNTLGIGVSPVANTSGAIYVRFYNATGNECGSITRVGTTNAVTYGTTSDYRLKENVQPMTGALNKVALLKPVTYIWKDCKEQAEGFIAHELQEVIPTAVSGEKDGVDAQGNPKYQNVDASYVVATLTAAIQELKAINDTQAETINALTARIVALESK